VGEKEPDFEKGITLVVWSNLGKQFEIETTSLELRSRFGKENAAREKKMSDATDGRRMSLKERMSLLNANGAGIPLPQIPGGAGGQRLHREGVSSDLSTRSESNLMSGSHPTVPLDVSQSERSLTSAESERLEGTDGFEVEENSLNAVALAKPTIAAGRRRPSRVDNFMAAIPAENRLTQQELALVQKDEGSVNKRQQDSALSALDRELTQGEQWLFSKITQMEREYSDRIAALELETAVLREALANAGLAIPPKSAPRPSSVTSTPQSVSAKRGSITSTPIASPASPVSKKPTTPIASAGAVKRNDTAESASSPRPMAKRTSSETFSLGSPGLGAAEKSSSPSGPARKIPAVPQGPRPVPSTPKQASPSGTEETTQASSELSSTSDTTATEATKGDDHNSPEAADAANGYGTHNKVATDEEEEEDDGMDML
jgi:hypothetical protein